MSLRDKVDGNELDLSLNELTEVPVKELAAANKATCLDLSCNLIHTLPEEFGSLTHLVRIDLSKNRLVQLCSNFGCLVNLQYLDLYGNQLKTVPISFCRLKNLRWLDLKKNPLEPELKDVAGDCSNAEQCSDCAKKVVAYMQSIDFNIEKRKQKMERVEKEKQNRKKAKMEQKLEEQRRVKKLQKEKRRAEAQALQQALEFMDYEPTEDIGPPDAVGKVAVGKDLKAKKGSKIWCVLFLCSVSGILGSVCAGYYLKLKNQGLQPTLESFYTYIMFEFSEDVLYAWDIILPYVANVKNALTNFYSSLLTFLAFYF